MRRFFPWVCCLLGAVALTGTLPAVDKPGKPARLTWAWKAPARSALPAVKNAAWVKNPVDAFILARLESEGLTPSPEADRATLIRRLSFDLIGLPPTPAEVDAFVK